MMKQTFVIIPCSGIGKAYGTICREAAYEVVEKRKPKVSRLLCLARLVKGDEEAIFLLKENPAIALDGCTKRCACKNINGVAPKPPASLAIMDLFRKHRDLNPNDLNLGTVLLLGEGGRRLVHLLADEVCRHMDRIED